MTKFKVGDKVRALAINGMLATTVHVEIGDVLTITRFGGNTKRYIYAENGDKVGYFAPNGVEKVSDKPTKNQRIKTLESEVAELKAKVEALEKAQKPTYKIGVDFAKPTPLSANEQRKAIIAEAKAFIEDVTQRIGNGKSEYSEGKATFRAKTTTAKFHVNKEKRVVTALVYGKHSGRLLEKAIAKCAPDDVFNADIGKAIALGRALGSDVKRFEQAVKPTEVVVGHVVKNNGCAGGIRECTKVEPGKVWRDNGHWIEPWFAEITDDTDAQY